MDEEASEDYSRLAGVSDIDSTSDSVFKTASKRLPWLIVLTFLGMITATILGSLKILYLKWHYLQHLFNYKWYVQEILAHNH